MDIDLNWIALLNWMELMELTINDLLIFFGGWWFSVELIYAVKSP